MKPSTTRTFYTVETYAMRKFPGVEAYWSMMGSGPGGKTIEEARERVKKDMIKHTNRFLKKRKLK